jgi:hypothetical protein
MPGPIATTNNPRNRSLGAFRLSQRGTNQIASQIEERCMSNPESPHLSPFEFGADLVSTMRSALDDAAGIIEEANRTPATIAKMAERMLRTASEGITDAERLTAVAVEEGAHPAD